MKKIRLLIVFSLAGLSVFSQDLRASDVPSAVKTALHTTFSVASKLSWEKEKGNYEANWGGSSGEDSSAQFTPSGNFVEWVQNIPVSSLPAKVAVYISAHYQGARIKEAGKVTDANGKHSFEAEIKGKDLIFDPGGNFVKQDK